MLACYLQMVPSVDSARVCAFLVGTDKYEEIHPLKNGVGDADKVEQALRKIGVERITNARDCNYEQLEKRTNHFLSRLRRGDVALVYVAAHAAIYNNQHVVLTSTSNETNLADTSLGEELLLTRLVWCYVLCIHDDMPILTPRTHSLIKQ